MNVKMSYGQALKAVLLLLALGGTWQVMRSDLATMSEKIEKNSLNNAAVKGEIKESETRLRNELKGAVDKWGQDINNTLQNLRNDVNRDRYYQYEADADKRVILNAVEGVKEKLYEEVEARKELQKKIEGMK